MICNVTNSLEAKPGLIFNFQECDVEIWSLQHTYTDNGLYSEVRNTCRQLIFRESGFYDDNYFIPCVLLIFKGNFKEIIKVVPSHCGHTDRTEVTPQRAHHTRTNSAATTDLTRCTAETLTHKHRLLWQQSNLRAWRSTINDYSILLVQSSYPGGTCKSLAIDFTAFDYIHWVKKDAEWPL